MQEKTMTTERGTASMLWRAGLVLLASPFIGLWIGVRYNLFEGEERADNLGQGFANWVRYCND